MTSDELIERVALNLRLAGLCHTHTHSVQTAQAAIAAMQTNAAPVAWMYERGSERKAYVERSQAALACGYTETPLYAHPPVDDVAQGWMPIPAAPVDNRVSTSSPVDDRAAPETSGKLRDAVAVWRYASDAATLGSVKYKPAADEAAAAIIEQDREAVRAEQAAEIERLRERLEIDPAHSIDGIYARDETIRGLEAELAKYKALAETLAGALDKLHEAYCADDYGTSEGRAFGRTALIETREALREYKEARDAS